MNADSLRNLKQKTIIVGGDHHAQPLAKIVYQYLQEIGLQTEIAPFNEKFCDYIDQARFVAQKVSASPDKFCGVIGCKNGFGVTTICNKYPSVFAARCDTPDEAIIARKVNYSNILTFGSDFIGEYEIKEIVDKWLATEFDINEKNKNRLNRLFSLDEEIHGSKR